MRAFLEGGSCRRIALDKHMDGRSDRTACEVGEERCDVCHGQPRGFKRRRIVVRNEDEQEEARKKLRMMEEEEAQKQEAYERF